MGRASTRGEADKLNFPNGARGWAGPSPGLVGAVARGGAGGAAGAAGRAALAESRGRLLSGLGIPVAAPSA